MLGSTKTESSDSLFYFRFSPYSTHLGLLRHFEFYFKLVRNGPSIIQMPFVDTYYYLGGTR